MKRSAETPAPFAVAEDPSKRLRIVPNSMRAPGSQQPGMPPVPPTPPAGYPAAPAAASFPPSFGLMGPLAQTAFQQIFVTGAVTADGIDDSVYSSLGKSFHDETAAEIVSQFGRADLTTVRNKTGFFIGILKSYRSKGVGLKSGPAPARAAPAYGGYGQAAQSYYGGAGAYNPYGQQAQPPAATLDPYAQASAYGQQQQAPSDPNAAAAAPAGYPAAPAGYPAAPAGYPAAPAGYPAADGEGGAAAAQAQAQAYPAYPPQQDQQQQQQQYGAYPQQQAATGQPDYAQYYAQQQAAYAQQYAAYGQAQQQQQPAMGGGGGGRAGKGLGLAGLSRPIQDMFQQCFTAGRCIAEDVPDSIYDSLHDFDEDTQWAIVERFSKADLGRVRNKTGYLIGILKMARQGKQNGHGFGASKDAQGAQAGFSAAAPTAYAPMAQSPKFQQLVPFVQQRLQEMVQHGEIKDGDLDHGVFDSLAAFDEASQVEIVEIFGSKELHSIRNKTGFFIGILKKQRVLKQNQDMVSAWQ